MGVHDIKTHPLHLGLGSITLHQENADGSAATVVLVPGQYVVNEPGTWHTADVEAEATALFITAGMGTEHRPR